MSSSLALFFTGWGYEALDTFMALYLLVWCINLLTIICGFFHQYLTLLFQNRVEEIKAVYVQIKAFSLKEPYHGFFQPGSLCGKTLVVERLSNPNAWAFCIRIRIFILRKVHVPARSAKPCSCGISKGRQWYSKPGSCRASSFSIRVKQGQIDQFFPF